MAQMQEKKDMIKKEGSVKGLTAAEVQSAFSSQTPEEKGALGHIAAPEAGDVPPQQSGEPAYVLGTPGGVEAPIDPIVGEPKANAPASAGAEETIDGDKIPELNVSGTVKPLDTPTPETSLAEIYKMLNPAPKERTLEEQEEYERQRKASTIILGVADAINGLSNLGATIYGAPSREGAPMAGKWAEVLGSAEKERQQRVDVYKANLMKYHIEDFRNKKARAEAAAKEKRDVEEYNRRSAAEKANQLELIREKDKLEAAREKARQQAAADLEDKRHQNEMAQISARAKASASSTDGNKPKERTSYFSTAIGDTNVDVRLRNKEDFHRLYDILAPHFEKDKATDSGLNAELTELTKLMGADANDPDGTRSATIKQNLVRKYFNKYYDKIKNDPAFKHLDVEFRDNQGNKIQFTAPSSNATSRTEPKGPLAHLNEGQPGHYQPNYTQYNVAPWRK